MSLLLEDLQVLIGFNYIQSGIFHDLYLTGQNQGSLEGNNKINLFQTIFQNRNQELIQFCSKDQTIQLYFLLNKVHKDLTYILKANINIKKFELKFQFKPLTQNNSHYIQLSSCQRRIYAQKSIYMLNKVKNNLLNQLKISIQTMVGTIKIQTPIFYQTIKDISSLPKQVKTFVNIFQKNLPALYQSLLTFLDISNYDPNKYAYQLFFRSNTKLKQIEKYTKLANLVVNIGSVQASQYQYYDNSTFNQHKSLSEINKNIISCQNEFSSRYLFYIYKQEMFTDVNQNIKQKQLTLNEFEKTTILEKLQIVQIKNMRESNKRMFIVNHMKLTKPLSELSYKKICKGGFSNIYKAEVFYFQIDSTSQQRIQPEIKKKQMIIKTQDPGISKSRIKHQKNILLKLKNALSIFLPKYYFATNLADSQNILFIEHVRSNEGSYNLEQYIGFTKPTLSLHSKIYIGFTILQGLRFLKDYQITHLDLKNSNLMISKRFQLKFVDFGESYHPSLKNHQPGVSMPYSAPENYSKKQKFNFKSDLFSFGVIMYNLLTSRYPFFVYSKKQREQIFSSICDRWYFSPQNLSQFGQTNIFPYILLLVGKCLNVDEKLRPQLEWVTLIFRQYFAAY